MNEEHTQPDEEVEEQLQEEAAEAEGMVPTPDDLPKAHLTMLRDGEATDEVFEVRSVAVLGRYDEAIGPVDIDLTPLPEAKFVSRKHAEIRFADGKWMLKDLGSSNGTFIQQEGDLAKIAEEAEIADGSVIAFGSAVFRFNVVPAAVPGEES